MKNKFVLISVALAVVVVGLIAWSRAGSGDASAAAGGSTTIQSTTSQLAGSGVDQKQSSTNKSTTSTKKSATTSTVRATRLRTVALAALPEEAQATWRLVQRKGPFPYDRDGITFENREGRLPTKPRGYYHEYTVTTPGESDRGARRLIVGSGGDVYYTDDHYDSFAQVMLAP